MSSWGVTIETIETIDKIDGAKSIDRGTISGCTFQFVVGKGSLKPGDKCVYFPVDSVLPEKLLKHIGLEGKLSGANKNRVKTKKMMKFISQGLVLTVAEVEKHLGSSLSGKTEISKDLEVTKFEPSEANSGGGNGPGRVRTSPRHAKVHLYDIEGTDRHKASVESMMEQPCFITEKLEGSNISILREANGTITICSKNMTVRTIKSENWIVRLWNKFFKKPIVDNWYYPATINSDLISKINRLGEIHSGKDVIIRGEVLGPGVQENIYKLPTYKAVTFDIQIDGQYLNALKFIETCQQMNIEIPPILCLNRTLTEWLGGKTIAEASDGVSKLYETKREGIVIKPMIESRDPRLGRLFFKKRSPSYLADNEL